MNNREMSAGTADENSTSVDCASINPQLQQCNVTCWLLSVKNTFLINLILNTPTSILATLNVIYPSSILTNIVYALFVLVCINCLMFFVALIRS